MKYIMFITYICIYLVIIDRTIQYNTQYSTFNPNLPLAIK